MIQANELRIGNWVKLKGTDRIYTITFPLHNDLAEQWHNTLNHIEPISITPEILEKCYWNGYNKLSINSNFKIDKEGRLYYCGDYTGINIDCLHQLQNLYFALTGQELNIQP